MGLGPAAPRSIHSPSGVWWVRGAMDSYADLRAAGPAAPPLIATRKGGIMRKAFSAPTALVSFGLLSLAMAPAGAAADLSGYVSGTVKVVQTLPLSGDRVAKRMRYKLSIVTDDPTSPFNLASQDCMATNVFSKEGKSLGGHGYCDGITSTGDIWWIATRTDADGTVYWTNLGGTGKLEGVTASGTSHLLAAFDDGKVIIRFQGTRSN